MANKTSSALRVLDLFSGIGGFSLGLERTGGFETVAFCEIDPFCRRVLAKHWPNVRQYEDVRELTARRLEADGIAVDVITGGFPCQDISIAGKQAGIENGTRSGLWSEIVRLARDLRPRYILVENVANLLAGPSDRRGGWFGRVLGDLAEIGYDAEWHSIPASAVGACHHRERVWIVAYGSGTRTERLVAPVDFSALGPWGWCGEEDLRAVYAAPFGRSSRWPQPLIRRMDDGISNRMDRVKSCGNSVVPQIPEILSRAILAAETAKSNRQENHEKHQNDRQPP